MAAVDYFLKLEGAPGESQDHKHKDEIDVLSFSFGAQNSSTFAFGGGGGAGKVNMQDFHFVMNVNKASPALFLKCASGEHLGSAILTCRKAGGEQQEYLIVTFTDVMVSNFQTNGDAHANSLPTDSVTLAFGKIEWAYKVQDAKGQLGAAHKTGYDLKQMKKV